MLQGLGSIAIVNVRRNGFSLEMLVAYNVTIVAGAEMPLFGKSQKNPTEVVKALKEAVTALERGEKKAEKAQEEVTKQLGAVKAILFGSADTEQQTEILVAQLSQELYNTNLLLLLINNLSRIEFEVGYFCFQILKYEAVTVTARVVEQW